MENLNFMAIIDEMVKELELQTEQLEKESKEVRDLLPTQDSLDKVIENPKEEKSKLDIIMEEAIAKIRQIKDKELSDKHANILGRTIEKIMSQIDKDIQYDEAFAKSVKMFGHQYFASKIYEKSMRIVHLSKDNRSGFESMEDTLEDCMGYCMLALAEIRR